MRGNITRRGKHSWRIKYDVGTDEHGKRLIQWKTVRGTKREAEQELARLLNELAEGRYVVPSAETVATYSRHWLDTVAAMSDKVSQSSLERYRTRVAAYIIPAIGDIPLQSLDGRALDKFYTYLRTKAGRRSKGLAPATVRGVHVVLSRILKSAVKSR